MDGNIQGISIDDKLTSKENEDTERLQPVYCMSCRKLLGKINGKAELKCHRCKTMNAFH